MDIKGILKNQKYLCYGGEHCTHSTPQQRIQFQEAKAIWQSADIVRTPLFHLN